MTKDNKKPRNPAKEVKEFAEEVIQIDRVTRVVKGGRRLRFRATVAIGNHKGKVGIGIGKSTEVTGAISKAINQAKKSLVTVPMIGTTIPHKIYNKYKSSRIMLMPANPGTGIKAGGSLRKIVELAGVKDILSKSLGTNNRVVNSQCAIEALSKLKQLPWIKLKKAETLDSAPSSESEQFSESKKAAPKAHAKPHHKAPKNAEDKSE